MRPCTGCYPAVVPLEEPGRPKAQRITVITCEATNRFLADRVWPRMGACCGDRSVMGLRSPRLSRMAVTLSWSTRTARARDVRTPVLLLYAGDGTLARQDTPVTARLPPPASRPTWSWCPELTMSSRPLPPGSLCARR